MKYLILALVCMPLILSCNNKKKENDYFVIKSIAELRKVDSTIFFPAFYGYHNYILTEDNRVFYHDNYVFYWCGTGIDYSKPPRLDITPDSLIEIKNLSEFLKKNAVEKLEETLVTIASDNDTIKNVHFEEIRNFFKSRKQFKVNVRMWTEEEKYVLESKINKIKYDPKKIKWEIGFDQGINPLETIKFLPPVVDK